MPHLDDPMYAILFSFIPVFRGSSSKMHSGIHKKWSKMSFNSFVLLVPAATTPPYLYHLTPSSCNLFCSSCSQCVICVLFCCSRACICRFLLPIADIRTTLNHCILHLHNEYIIWIYRIHRIKNEYRGNYSEWIRNNKSNNETKRNWERDREQCIHNVSF